ncbi:serine/threonine-protein kinase grp [Tribolium castaneum]|uniref:non-specific serine/threonine protein kinase n=1 Tax=Tribolium castaneum TaxID=7070 RepID=D7EK22_TRICA|nr:grapes [Tribolium castaneum]
MIEFTEDWLMHKSILGEGAYGEVKLIVNKHTNEKVACKIINYGKKDDVQVNINKEVIIHKMLNHENIIKYFGRRREPLREYIYLEYASRGELFQMIEPDVGMPSSLAQLYMKQLLNGLHYLHNLGIVHRDIKPENLLINDDGVLKISDFGMATLFRCKGKERLLDRRCGTKPYCAPEILLRPYRAQPADIWSCGIVLIAMLTGELPWSDTFSEEFVNYKNDNYITVTPWSKLGNATLSLIRKILAIEPNKRLTIQEILKHPWMKYNFDDQKTDVVDDSNLNPVKRFNSMMETETRVHRTNPIVILSQPTPAVRPPSIDQLVTDLRTNRELVCFSQPTHNDDMLLSSQIQFNETPLTKDNFNNLVKRMTRFYVTTNYEKTLEVLCSVLDTFHYNWQIDGNGAVTISTVDIMKNQLMFKTNVIEIQGKILVDFRLSKGCGIEFKKKFKKLKECLDDIVEKNE